MSSETTGNRRSTVKHTYLTRRAFLRFAGTGAIYLAGAPHIALARRDTNQEDPAAVLSEADARIERYRKGSATLTFLGPDGQQLGANQRFRIEQTRHKFLFGCNVFKLNQCRTPEHNAAYAEYFVDLLNFATLPFYWWFYERRQGRPMDERTEEIARWCDAHHITMKGHPLAWNWSDPRWLEGGPKEAMRLQMARIERCVRRFRGTIDIWDVVNEATHYDRQETKEQAPLLTQAISGMGVGTYLRTAFERARRANPEATLLINDYRTDRAYADKVLSELVDDGGKPLYDVVGIQSHMHRSYWGPGRTWDVCQRFARFGKPLHFTETTVVSGPKKDSGWQTTPEGEQRQADLVAEFYTILFSHPAVEAITWWDFTDQRAWQGAPAGLLRDDMTPKPAYERLRSLIKDKWWTKAQLQTSATGQADFRGFLGDYQVETELGGRRLSGPLSLDRTGEASIAVQLA